MIDEIKNPFLTIPEVARLIGVCPSRAYQMVAKGQLPGVKLSPKRVRIPREALERWLAQQTERALHGVDVGGTIPLQATKEASDG